MYFLDFDSCIKYFQGTMKVCEEVPIENCQLVTRTVCDGDLDLKPQGPAPSNCKKVVKPSCRIDKN